MRLISAPRSGRILFLLIVVVCLAGVLNPAVTLGREDYTSDTRSGEGDPGDGSEYGGGSGSLLLGEETVYSKECESEEYPLDEVEIFILPKLFASGEVWINLIPRFIEDLRGQK